MPNIGRARTASKMWHSTQLLRSAAHIRYMVPCDNIFLSLHRVEGVASIKAVQPWRDSHSETDEYRDILSCADRPPTTKLGEIPLLPPATECDLVFRVGWKLPRPPIHTSHLHDACRGIQPLSASFHCRALSGVQ